MSNLLSLIRVLAMLVAIGAILLFFAAKFVGFPLASLQEFAAGSYNWTVIFCAVVIVGITDFLRNRNVFF